MEAVFLKPAFLGHRLIDRVAGYVGRYGAMEGRIEKSDGLGFGKRVDACFDHRQGGDVVARVIS